MGDIINKISILKKLNFDSSNQWIIYDDNFQKFFNYFANNISDANIITQRYVQEQQQLISSNKYINSKDIQAKIKDLLKIYPGLMSNTTTDVRQVSQQITIMENALSDYQELINNMRAIKRNQLAEYNKQIDHLNRLVKKDNDLYSLCCGKCHDLEELQISNQKNAREVAETYSKMQSPPLFMHQLPINQYFIKHDLFMQYFSLYMEENFKIQHYMELNQTSANFQRTAEQLQKLQQVTEEYQWLYAIEKANSTATQNVIDLLDIRRIRLISLADMENEIHHLSVVNSHQEILQKSLRADLRTLIKEQVRNNIEMILFENTKEKLKKASQRHECDVLLTKIISDTLSNSEIIWINIQLDCEKERNRFDNTEQLTHQTQATLQRIQCMQNLIISNQNAVFNEFISQLSQQLSDHLQIQIRWDSKACLYEYEKFVRLLNYALQGLLNGKQHTSSMEKLKQIDRLELLLYPFIEDSPVVKPIFEKIDYLKAIFKAKLHQSNIDKYVRSLRKKFHENITERMGKDKLWRYRQLLWIWYLAEPRKVLAAIEEVKKIVSKIQDGMSTKTLGGIKRK